jgi:transcriptional regulator with XRE-family HTH domain
MPTSQDAGPPPRRPKRQVDLGATGEYVRRNIQRFRKRQGLTHTDVVERMKNNGYGVPRTAMSEIENGGRRVSVDDLMALAVALDVPPNALLLPLEDSAEDLQATGARGIPLEDLWTWANGGKSLEVLRNPLVGLFRPEREDRSLPVRPTRSTDDQDALAREALEALRKATQALEQLRAMGLTEAKQGLGPGVDMVIPHETGLQVKFEHEHDAPRAEGKDGVRGNARNL